MNLEALRKWAQFSQDQKNAEISKRLGSHKVRSRYDTKLIASILDWYPHLYRSYYIPHISYTGEFKLITTAKATFYENDAVGFNLSGDIETPALELYKWKFSFDNHYDITAPFFDLSLRLRYEEKSHELIHIDIDGNHTTQYTTTLELAAVSRLKNSGQFSDRFVNLEYDPASNTISVQRFGSREREENLVSAQFPFRMMVNLPELWQDLRPKDQNPDPFDVDFAADRSWLEAPILKLTDIRLTPRRFPDYPYQKGQTNV